MEIYRTKNGDSVVREGKGIIVYFGGKRRVLSTSVFRGGLHEDCTAVFNYDGTWGNPTRYRMLADTYEEHMTLVAQRLALDSMQVTGMDTAAQMENVAIATRSYRDLTVTAIVTGGVEENGGRVGDKADYYEPDSYQHHHGTINIIVLINADVGDATLARALVTVTEAKVAALQERLSASCYSSGLATGSGTDQTILVADADSPIYFTDAGKHSKLGELLGATVIEAVKRALENQTGLNKDKQFSVMRRIGRFGHTYESVLAESDVRLTDEQKAYLAEFDRDRRWVVESSLIAHLCDQYQWGLLEKDEKNEAIRRILDDLTRDYGLVLSEDEAVDTRALIRLMIMLVKKER